jgi:predicted lipase
VHSGFLAVYLDIRDLILRAVSSSSATRVCVAGHSLGGALAQFASYDIAVHNPEKSVDTIVFGCPRVGNAAFAETILQPVNVNSFVMLTNTCDLVPNLPLAVQPTIKCDEPLIYVHPLGSHNFTDNRHTWTSNHMMGVYIQYVESLMDGV